MSFKNLLNVMCKIERFGLDNSSENEFNEEVDEPIVIQSDVPCRLEKLYDRELVEAYAGGDHDKGIYCLYVNIGTNIRASDLITVYETVKISGFTDTNVNGIYVRSEDTQLNDMLVYILNDIYRLFFNGDYWIIQDIDTDDELYRTISNSLNCKQWIVIGGTEETGKSRLRIVPDFHYNSFDHPSQLIVNDVEDAGGGQQHHIQCFCRYRKGID